MRGGGEASGWNSWTWIKMGEPHLMPLMTGGLDSIARQKLSGGAGSDEPGRGLGAHQGGQVDYWLDTAI